MRSYVDLYFATGEITPPEIAERVRHATGLSFLHGPHDLLFEWETVEEFRAILGRIHESLRGSGAFYRVETVDEDPAFTAPVPWPSLPPRPPSHPAPPT